MQPINNDLLCDIFETCLLISFGLTIILTKFTKTTLKTRLKLNHVMIEDLLTHKLKSFCRSVIFVEHDKLFKEKLLNACIFLFDDFHF